MPSYAKTALKMGRTGRPTFAKANRTHHCDNCPQRIASGERYVKFAIHKHPTVVCCSIKLHILCALLIWDYSNAYVLRNLPNTMEAS